MRRRRSLGYLAPAARRAPRTPIARVPGSSRVMPFVGRRAEIRRVWGALSHGRHIVVAGPHGIGRTSLRRCIASGCGSEMPFVFADMSATGAEVGRVLHDGLGAPGRAADLSYRTVRHRLLHDIGQRSDPCVVVLDDFTRVSRSRLGLVSGLARAGRFRIAAILGTRLPKVAVDAVRACLGGAELVPLGWLPPREVREFLRQASAANRFASSEDEIEARARLVGGYPLAMTAAVDRERLLRSTHQDSGHEH